MMTRQKVILISLSLTLLSGQAMAFNYGEALQKSIYFYEAQQSGVLPDWNRVEWRGDSATKDGSDVGHDLTGGWYDAGDHVKFGFPMAATATMLAWGVVDYRSAYEQSGQLEHIKNNLKFTADYFIKAHTAPNELWGQLGHGSTDHAWWGSAEVMQMERPAYKIDAKCPGSDLAGETAAALAAIAMVFQPTDATYAGVLIRHARELYDFAYDYRGKYSDCIKDATSFYNSWSGYNDELTWGAIWLYRATGEARYLGLAVDTYTNLNTEQGSTMKSYKWTYSWDDKSYPSYVLMAMLTGDEQYQTDAERWLDYWTVGYNGSRVRYSPGGFAFLDNWGPARYSANTAYIALVYSDFLRTDPTKSDKATRYYDFARGQMEYLLGNNPLSISYQIGFGAYHPKNPHHRTAHGSWGNSLQSPAESRHLLVGALVGGPDANDRYTDDRGDYYANEVATDYNAAFTSALARLYLDFGGQPIDESEFPAKEERDLEYFVEAKVNSAGTRHMEIGTITHNRSAWPAKVTEELSFRYWVNLSEVFAAGYSLADVKISTAYNQASKVSGPLPWGDPKDHLYYIDISFAGVKIFPGGQSESRKEVQFRMSLPTNNNLPEWDNTNDPSWDNYNDTHKPAPKIALYDAGKLVWGNEPSPGCGKKTGINCIPTANNIQVKTKLDHDVAITLAGADSDGEIIGFKIMRAPRHGALSGSGPHQLYTPKPGFYGEDSFTYSAIDDDDALSEPAMVSITVEGPVTPKVTITEPVNESRFRVNTSFQVAFVLKDAPSARLLFAGEVVGSYKESSIVTLTAPSTPGEYVLTLIAFNENGDELGIKDDKVIKVVAASSTKVSCTLGSNDIWNSGFVLNNIVVTNESDSLVSDWQLVLTFANPTTITNIWNARYTATNDGKVMRVNAESGKGSLAPGQSTTFGFQGVHDGNFILPVCSGE